MERQGPTPARLDSRRNEAQKTPSNNMVKAALSLLKARFSVIPADRNKRPTVSWKEFQDRHMTEAEARRHFTNGVRLAVVAGRVSGNLECIDFDDPETFEPFLELLALRSPALPEKLLHRRTPSGGYHLVYRSATPVAGNLKLACKAAGEVRIETRGEGGYFLSAPSPGYEVIKGRLTECCTLSAPEVLAIHETAKAFDQRNRPTGDAPGHQFNQAHTAGDILAAHGWKPDRPTSGGQGWTRPDKESGTSGVVLRDTGNFYCFSSNAAPLEPGQSYSPFALYAAYKHGGDYSGAARQLLLDGYGAPGKKGERGEKPHGTRKNAGAKPGLNRAKNLPAAQLDALRRRADEQLKPTAGSSVEYPVDALCEIADACKDIASGGQVPVEMAGQCLLATAALLVQSVANVRTLAGDKPLSLYGLTIAESGEGKSTADDAAQRAVVDWQRAASKSYQADLLDFESAKKIRKKNDPEPEAPCEPYRIMRDGTVEGIRRAFRQGIPSQGVFSSEAAMMLAGYGMSDDHRAKTAGNFNALWDNGEISVARGTDGRLQLYDRRLSLHWLVQPDVAFSALHDPMLANIGFWPRFLLACPAPSAPLLARRFEPGSSAAIRAFWNRCEELLAAPLGEDCSSLTVISPTPEAEKLACRFFEKMQQEAKTSGGELVEVKPFAVRATEQAFRIAGVLSAYSGNLEIDVDTMRRAILLAGYSLDNWRLAFGDREENAARRWARLLFDWLLKQPDHRATGSDMLQVGPKQIRAKAKRDAALALLQQAGLVDGDMGGYFLCGVEL